MTDTREKLFFLAVGMFVGVLACMLVYLAFAGAIETKMLASPKENCLQSATLLISPGAGPSFVKEVDSAQSEIEVMLYQFSYPELKDALARAAQRGVKVRIILESAVDTNYETAKFLKEKGVQVGFDAEFKNYHAKTMVVDRKIVVIGSTNWSRNAMNENREIALRTESPQMAEALLSVFEADWKEAQKV